jgi:hypothetical protein
MGNSIAVEKNKGKDYIPEEQKSELLLFERCVYMTQKMYVENGHIPSNFYIEQGNINIKGKSIINELNILVINNIINLANKLSKINGVPAKVPGPIYFMYAKKLEYSGTILGNCFDDFILDQNYIEIDTTSPSIFIKDMMAKIQKYPEIKETTGIGGKLYKNCSIKNDKDNMENYLFIKQLINNKEEIETLKKSNLAKYTYKNNIQYYIYYPSLNTNLKYLTNYNSYLNTNIWMSNIVSNYYLFNIIDINDSFNIQRRKLTQILGIKNEKKINKFIEELIIKDKENYPFIPESLYTCYNNGCVSEYGEDFDELLPKKTDNKGEQEKNAEEKAPYYPTKCLKKVNYHDNMFINFKEEEFITDIKKNLFEKCLKDYKENYDKVKNGNTEVVDTDPSIINELKNCFSKYRKENSGSDLNGDSKYKYSKKYNKNILTELSNRFFSYPGAQEVTFPLLNVNSSDERIKNYMLLLPWGEQLISPSYFMGSDDVFSLIYNKKIYSFNNLFYMTLDKNGIIMVKNSSDIVIYIINTNFIYNIINVKFESGSINVYIKNKKNIILGWSVKCIDYTLGKSPYSLILDDNGDINIYGDKFVKVTSDNFKNLIAKSRKYFENHEYDEKIEINYNNTFINTNPIYDKKLDIAERILKEVDGKNF